MICLVEASEVQVDGVRRDGPVRSHTALTATGEAVREGATTPKRKRINGGNAIRHLTLSESECQRQSARAVRGPVGNVTCDPQGQCT